jgi:hypothetical protein
MQSESSVPQIERTSFPSRTRPRTPSPTSSQQFMNRSLSVSALLLIAGLCILTSVALSEYSTSEDLGIATRDSKRSLPDSVRANSPSGKEPFSNDGFFNGLDAASQMKLDCRHTVASPHFVTDDSGYICQTSDVVYRSAQSVSRHTGCCSRQAQSSERYACTSCDPNLACCIVYENCVSCCMAPKAWRETVAARKPTLDQVDPRDIFSLCQAMCRSSSSSVAHENSYRHRRHHCFGAEPPQLDNSMYNGVFRFINPNK